MGLFGPKQNPKAIGERSQAVIIFKLLEAGYNVLTPYGDNTRYDLEIEDADGTSTGFSVKQVGLRTMVLISHLKPPAHTTIQGRERRTTEEETIEGRLIISPSIALIQGRCTLYL